MQSKNFAPPENPDPKRKDSRLLTTAAHGMRQHSRKFFWFFLFTKRTVPSCRQSKLSISKRTGCSDKCLEATQLKTVRTVIVVLRVDPIVVEVQEVGIGARNRRRPAVPVVADVTQSTETAGTHSVAVAREPTITSSQTNVRAAAWLLGRREREKGEFRFPPVFFSETRDEKPEHPTGPPTSLAHLYVCDRITMPRTA